MKKNLMFLCVFTSCFAMAQGFDYAGYGISDPAAFHAAMQQSNATIMQMAAQMQQTAAACEASMREMARQMPPPTPQQQFVALNAIQDAQLMSLQMQSASLDAEMSANACRRHEMDLIREQGAQRCAWASGVSLEQYNTANQMGLHQLNGSCAHPQANNTYYGNGSGKMYRIGMNGTAYEVTSTGEYLVP